MSAQFFVQIQALRQVTERQAAEIAELKGQITALHRAVLQMQTHDSTPDVPTPPLGLRRAKNGYKRT